MDEDIKKQSLVIVGQTPPPWHGQAVATKLLFEYEWKQFKVRKVRMAFSSEMDEIGRVRIQKLVHLFKLWKELFSITQAEPNAILLYPPASPNWIPVLRDLILLSVIRRRFAKVVYIYHAGGVGAWFEQSTLRRLVGRITYGRADLCLEVSKENPPPHDVLRARRWAWTPYGVELPELESKPRFRDENVATVLFVGSLQEGKGVLEVIRTAAVIKRLGQESNFHFQIVGRWFSKEFETAAMNLVRELDVEGLVSFPGQLTGKEKWSAYRNADIFFFPSHYESEAFPLVLIEALGCGMPIVTTKWRGIPDLVSDCEFARICEIHSPEQYAECVLSWRQVLSEKDISAEIRAFYEERYLPSHFLRQVEKLISSLHTQPASNSAGLHVVPSKSSRQTHPTRAPIAVRVYLADQNPGYDRSFGISRMSYAILKEMQATTRLRIETVVSKNSQRGPEELPAGKVLPWSTRSKVSRFLTDHFHPVLTLAPFSVDFHYFPKGYLPLTNRFCAPSVVTIHDTIIQYDEDNYPMWRSFVEYGYWAMMLKHTLRNADRIMTVSESAKQQIKDFMARHRIPEKPITVTYEPCAYEHLPQPITQEKENFVIHLASVEPHKRTAHLIQWWYEAESAGRKLPMLHLIGSVPPESMFMVRESSLIKKRPFLADHELQEAYEKARALILPSEIEGFGLPALEAYYLGTPVCFVKGTSVEEVLGVATTKGGFDLETSESLFTALEEFSSMDPDEVRNCGLRLREVYAAERVVERMLEVFSDVVATRES